ncbi:MAG TPA: GreA/GreB family elongation factor [Candidatus Sulfotelmatobacter sp.]|nr:GreA/GreB family elongation factor [Candidatus Sulfotelmatobacter sp.]
MQSITVTDTNLGSLRNLLAAVKRVAVRSHDHLVALEEQLKTAQVVSREQVPPDVITINTQARIYELDCGRKTVYTVVFPREADVARNRISVLAPFGSVLLGYRVGDVVACVSSGSAKRLKVHEIVYQPEAAQRFQVNQFRNLKNRAPEPNQASKVCI